MILSHMFDIKNNTAPGYLSQNFVIIDHQYQTRGALCNFIVPRPVGVTAANFCYNGTKLWNELPSWIKCTYDKNCFKRKVKKYFRLQAQSQ